MTKRHVFILAFPINMVNLIATVEIMTLAISDWLFYLEGGASIDRVAILSIALFLIQNYCDTSWVYE